MAKQVALPPQYSVPANWRWIEMGEVTFVRSGFPFNSKKFSKESNGRKPLIRIRDVVRGSTETFTDEECPDEYIIHNGDILIGMDGDFNVAKWNTGDALLNQRVCYICSSSDALLNDFLFFFLPEQLKKINAATPSVTVKHLSTKTLAKTPIPLPPLPEQQRIVERIESLFAKLDEAKEKAQAVVDGFEERKAAILHKAFTGELTKKWRAGRGIRLSDWKYITLKECSLTIGDGLHGTPIYDESGQYFFINGNNFAGTYIEIKPDTKTVNDEQYQKYRVELTLERTVFVSINGTLGKTAFYNDEPVILGKSACYVNVKDCLSKYFLRYFFESNEFISYAHTMATGSTIKNLGLKAMRSLMLHLPGIPEQNEIVRILDSLLEKHQQAKSAAEQVLDQIDTMKKAILARAFRGELGTNDAGEESAVELVKRVL